MKIEKRKISQIKPYWRNPRINDGAVEVVKKSINDYGYNSPIGVDKDGVIIIGHTRYKALMQLGYEDIYVSVLDHLTKKQAKEYRIADNKTSEFATWNLAELIPELREIEDTANMNEYFQGLDVEQLVNQSVGSFNFKDITEQNMEKVQDKMSKQFGDQESKDRMLADQIEVICPHCLEEFAVSRDQVNKSA